MTLAQQNIIAEFKKINCYSSWESELRQRAIGQVSQHGLPHRKLEAWKYTSLSQLEEKKFHLTTPNHLSNFNLSELNLPDIPKIVYVDGFYSEKLSTHVDINVINLQQLLQTDATDLERYFNQTESPNEHGIADINSALFQDGIFLNVETNQKIDIALIFISTNETNHSMHHVRNIIRLGENSQAKLVEYHLSLNSGESYSSYIHEVFLAENSHCDWVQVQNLANEQIMLSETRVEQQKHSQFKHYNVDIGGRLSRHDLQINLNQPGSYCSLDGLYKIAQNQHIDNHTTINHRVSDTTSRQHYKGIIDGHAQAVFNGRVVVHKDAHRVSTKQYNPNILLSNHAEVDTKPQLEIYNDDVQATHGATVGQLDESAIFYLQSRGIDKTAAIELLLQGFVQEIIVQIPLPDWQEYILKHLLGYQQYA